MKKAFFNKKGINLILINSINNNDAVSKFEKIFTWLKNIENTEKGLSLFREKLRTLYNSKYEENFKKICKLIKFDQKIGLTFGAGVFHRNTIKL